MNDDNNYIHNVNSLRTYDYAGSCVCVAIDVSCWCPKEKEMSARYKSTTMCYIRYFTLYTKGTLNVILAYVCVFFCSPRCLAELLFCSRHIRN